MANRLQEPRLRRKMCSEHIPGLERPGCSIAGPAGQQQGYHPARHTARLGPYVPHDRLDSISLCRQELQGPAVPGFTAGALCPRHGEPLPHPRTACRILTNPIFTAALRCIMYVSLHMSSHHRVPGACLMFQHSSFLQASQRASCPPTCPHSLEPFSTPYHRSNLC